MKEFLLFFFCHIISNPLKLWNQITLNNSVFSQINKLLSGCLTPATGKGGSHRVLFRRAFVKMTTAANKSINCLLILIVQSNYRWSNSFRCYCTSLICGERVPESERDSNFPSCVSSSSCAELQEGETVV